MASNDLLRKWMRSQDIYDVDLEEILTEVGVLNPSEDLQYLKQSDWEQIYRKAFVERGIYIQYYIYMIWYNSHKN